MGSTGGLGIGAVLAQVVALKLWRTVLDDQARARFRRETDVLRQLEGHPNILGMKRAEAPIDAPAWMTTELCEQSLADLLRRGPVALADAFAIADDVLCGLAAVHAADTCTAI
jgi:serine/threonine protein kinase